MKAKGCFFTLIENGSARPLVSTQSAQSYSLLELTVATEVTFAWGG